MSSTEAHHGDHPRFLAHHFDSMEQQFDSCKLGVWLFLVTEVLFFSALFVSYAVYRSYHPEIFSYAHHFLDKNLGALNTCVLIFSSFTIAWSIRAAQLGQRQRTVVLLAITLLCGAAFMVVKYIEYSHKWHHGLLWGSLFQPSDISQLLGDGVDITRPINAHIFFGIYFCMTALHGIHVLVGMGLIAWVMSRAAKGHFGPDYFGPVEYVGLYWHLVDLIWIFLFPLLYLIE